MLNKLGILLNELMRAYKWKNNYLLLITKNIIQVMNHRMHDSWSLIKKKGNDYVHGVICNKHQHLWLKNEHIRKKLYL